MRYICVHSMVVICKAKKQKNVQDRHIASCVVSKQQRSNYVVFICLLKAVTLYYVQHTHTHIQSNTIYKLPIQACFCSLSCSIEEKKTTTQAKRLLNMQSLWLPITFSISFRLVCLYRRAAYCKICCLLNAHMGVKQMVDLSLIRER